MNEPNRPIPDRRNETTTGWPTPELMQDGDRKLFRWFASRPDARRLVRELAQRILKERA